MKKDINDEFDKFLEKYLSLIYYSYRCVNRGWKWRAKRADEDAEKLIADFHDKLYKLGEK